MPTGFHVSSTEMIHLAASVGILSVAFAFAFAHFNSTLNISIPTEREVGFAIQILPYSFLIVVMGFLLHEMAHKVVAQRLSLWAEFRASLVGLIAALGLCVLTPILFAAPGAVLIVGNATRKDGALISIAGPATNIAIGFAVLPFVGSSANPIEVGPNIGNFFQLALLVNSLLAVFNLMPFPPLDGSKIIRWSIPTWLGMMGLAVVLFLKSSNLL